MTERRLSPAQLAALERLFVSGPDYRARFNEQTIASLIARHLVGTGKHYGKAAVRLTGAGVYFMGGGS